MKKILMIVLMTVFTGLVAFADNMPEEITESFGFADYLYILVLEDIEYKNININNIKIYRDADDFYHNKTSDGVDYLIVRFDTGEIRISIIYDKTYTFCMNGCELLKDVEVYMRVTAISAEHYSVGDEIKYLRVQYEQNDEHIFNIYQDLEEDKVYKEWVYD